MRGFTSVSLDEMLRWLTAVVEHPSEQSDALERDPAVQSLAPKCIQPIVSNHGLVFSYDPIGNLLVQTGPPNAPVELAVFAYAMTHPRAGMSDPFKCDRYCVENQVRLRGRGISEQKAALAASLAAFIDVSASMRPRSRIAWILLTAGETGRHDAIESAIKALGEIPRRAILAIGTAGHIETGHRGRLDIEVFIRGRAAHSSAPWLGVDATRGVEVTLARARRIARKLPRHPDLGPALLTCTSIHTAPIATHTVQAEARLTFDRRLLPHESADEVFAHLREALRLKAPLAASVERGAFMHGFLLPADAAVLTRTSQILRGRGLAMPPTSFASGALDAGFLQQLGTDAFMWGPGQPDQFHTSDESVEIGAVVSAAECYRAVLEDAAAA